MAEEQERYLQFLAQRIGIPLLPSVINSGCPVTVWSCGGLKSLSEIGAQFSRLGYRKALLPCLLGLTGVAEGILTVWELTPVVSRCLA